MQYSRDPSILVTLFLFPSNTHLFGTHFFILLLVKTGYQKNRQLLRMANLQQFLAVSCQLHKYISQNLGSDGHLEGLNMLKSQLNQNL